MMFPSVSVWRIEHYPRVDNDLLIFAASFRRSPSAPDVFCLLQLMGIMYWRRAKKE